MASSIDIEQEFRAALGALGAARRATPWPTAPGKALELWLLFRIAQHLKGDGWAVSLRDGAGNPLASGAPFITRAQPGMIPAQDPAKAGFILVTSPGTRLLRSRSFELHGSLQYRGRSRAPHECDISALPTIVGRAIRTRGGGRPTGIPPVAVECKHHQSDGSIGEAREKLARLFDLTYVRRCPPRNGWQVFRLGAGGGVGWGRRHHWYKARFQDGLYAIARSAGFQSGARRLLDHYRLRHFSWVTKPGYAQPLLDAVRDELA